MNLEKLIDDRILQLEEDLIRTQITKILTDISLLKEKIENEFFENYSLNGHNIKNDNYSKTFVYYDEDAKKNEINSFNDILRPEKKYILYSLKEPLRLKTNNERYSKNQFCFTVYVPKKNDTLKDLLNYLIKNYKKIIFELKDYIISLLKENFDIFLTKNMKYNLSLNHEEFINIPLLNKKIQNKYIIESFEFDKTYQLFIKINVKNYPKMIRFKYESVEDTFKKLGVILLEDYNEEIKKVIIDLLPNIINYKDFHKIKNNVFIYEKDVNEVELIKTKKDDISYYLFKIPLTISAKEFKKYIINFTKLINFHKDLKKSFILLLKENKLVYNNQKLRDKIILIVDKHIQSMDFSKEKNEKDVFFNPLIEIPDSFIYSKKIINDITLLMNSLLIDDIVKNKEQTIKLVQNNSFTIDFIQLKEDKLYVKNLLTIAEKKEHKNLFYSDDEKFIII